MRPRIEEDLDRQQEKMTSTCDLILTALHVYDYLGWMALIGSIVENSLKHRLRCEKQLPRPPR